MPIYDFHCPSCESDHEILVRSSADWKETRCPQCGSRPLRKKLSVFAAASTAGEASPCSGNPRSCGRCAQD
ncbi:MAG TPA: zinc ribbon domain-containing protein [Verrucomicrobiales bacterium]|nr:zinc ribbon domain-containing protein [Verrucomicrobiales bacterium]